MGNSSLTILSSILRFFAIFLALGAVGVSAFAGWLMSKAEDTDKAVEAKKYALIGGGVFLAAILFFGIASFIRPNEATVTNEAKKETSTSVATTIKKESEKIDQGKSCNVNKAGDTCQATSSACSVNEYCGKNDCLCHPLQGIGGSCNSGADQSCQADNEACAEFLDCKKEEGCQCSGAPVIQSISPIVGENPSGMAGDFITITGLYFGSSTGDVYFTNSRGSTTVLAVVANGSNVDCTNSWNNKQIVVAIPKGASVGPIKVQRKDGQSDMTNDTRGVNIGNFSLAINPRPSLCLVEPDNAYINNSFILRGIKIKDNLSTTSTIKISYDKYTKEIDGINGWATSSVKGIVPLVRPGEKKIFISKDSLVSNSLSFSVSRDNQRPYINDINLKKGPKGQYLTIYGENFGAYDASTSLVTFYDPIDNATTTADGKDLSKSCTDRWWYDGHIVIVIPNNLIVGHSYIIQVKNFHNQVSPWSDDKFLVESGQAGPGICFVDPFNSLSGFPISIYGNGFGGNRTGNSVVFASGKNGIFGTRDVWSNQKLDVRVPAGAIDGQLFVKIGDKESNSLPFKTTKCTDNNQCDLSETCCADGTFWAGTCRRDGACERVEPGRSGYGWTFNTAMPKPDTCAGYQNEQACSDAGTCPNSPGKCSVGESKIVGNGCGDGYCAYNYAACIGDKCKYNRTNNKCEIIGSSCSSSILKTDSSLVCPNGFDCESGKCISVSSVCPKESSCNGENQCVKSQSSCECCCHVGNDAQDCCTGLTCTPGNCGAGAGYGLCTGCSKDLNNNGKIDNQSEVDASNEACNCVPGKENRYCDTYDARYPQGVCRDRAKTGDDCRAMTVTASTTCNNTNFSPCQNTDFCDPGKGCTCQTYAKPGAPCSGIQPDVFHINPFNKSDGATCTNDNPPCDASAGYTCDAKSCTCQTSGGQAGVLCKTDGMPGCSTGAGSCAQSYKCIDKQQSDCRCCCDPTPDAYGKVMTNPYGLSCYADKTPCDGDKRGLFCGCTSDEQCDGGSFAGCSMDTCCRERPQVESVVPSNEAVNICRNAQLSATFNQVMNPATFANNVLVVGDYGQDQCPKDKPYLALISSEEKPASFINRIIVFFKNLIPGFSNVVKAESKVAGNNNFCSVPGIISDYINSDGTKTILTFSPTEAFDPGITYHVIIKGDTNQADSVPEGVLSEYGVGLVGDISTKLGSVNFENAYSWQFTTLNQDQKNNGLCALDHIDLIPSSYLFQTVENNITEDDSTKSSPSFDTVADKDKLFVAKSIASNNQEITPVRGYSWKWTWSIDNITVANFIDKVGGLGENEKFVEAMHDVKDAQTYLNVTAKIADDIYIQPSTVGESFNDTSDIWVFVCDNPWPPKKNGEWRPWYDNNSNCTAGAGTGTCSDTNFQMYYCRDTGGIGTADDLPAILSDKAVIRPSNLSQNIFKEFYFLREVLPKASTKLIVFDAGIGKTVKASWSPVVGAVKYKLYYGIKSHGYNSFVSTTTTSAVIGGLIDNVKYYFALTSLNEKNVESPFTEEISVIPGDSDLPPAPVDVKAEVSSGILSIKWTKGGDDIIGYKVYFGSKSKNYGGTADVGNVDEYHPTGLVAGNRYYFVVASKDNSGNESHYSSEIEAVVPSNKQ